MVTPLNPSKASASSSSSKSIPEGDQQRASQLVIACSTPLLGSLNMLPERQHLGCLKTLNVDRAIVLSIVIESVRKVSNDSTRAVDHCKETSLKMLKIFKEIFDFGEDKNDLGIYNQFCVDAGSLFNKVLNQQCVETFFPNRAVDILLQQICSKQLTRETFSGSFKKDVIKYFENASPETKIEMLNQFLEKNTEYFTKLKYDAFGFVFKCIASLCQEDSEFENLISKFLDVVQYFQKDDSLPESYKLFLDSCFDAICFKRLEAGYKPSETIRGRIIETLEPFTLDLDRDLRGEARSLELCTVLWERSTAIQKWHKICCSQQPETDDMKEMKNRFCKFLLTFTRQCATFCLITRNNYADPIAELYKLYIQLQPEEMSVTNFGKEILFHAEQRAKSSHCKSSGSYTYRTLLANVNKKLDESKAKSSAASSSSSS